MESLFEKPAMSLLGACFLAEVVSVEDPDKLSRVQVRIYNADGVSDHDAPVWARVAVPFAGGDMGAFFIPNVGDEVLIAFINGDSRYPVVTGSLWNGNQKAPETLPGSRVDRWTFVGKNGTRIAIVEESGGQETISLTTPNETVSATLTADSGGKIELKTPTSTITLGTSGVDIKTSAKLTVNASAQVSITSPLVKVDTAMADFSMAVKCKILIAETVNGKTYTPGVGKSMVAQPITLRGVRTNVVSARPTIIERTDENFVEAVMARMGEGASGIQKLESGIASRRDTASNTLKLLQPVQRTFNMALLETVCDPAEAIVQQRLDPARIESAGLVLRRLAVDQAGRIKQGVYEGWRFSDVGQRGWIPFPNDTEARVDPDPARRPVFTLGHPALDQRLSLVQARPLDLTEDVSPLFVAPPNLCDKMERTVLFGVVNVTSSEFSARPNEDAFATTDLVQAIPLFMTQGGERNIPYGGSNVSSLSATNPSLVPFVLFLRQLAVEFNLFGDTPQAQALLTSVNTLSVTLPDSSVMKLGDFVREAVRILVAGENGALALPSKWPAISADMAATFFSLLGDSLEARFRFIQPNEGRFDARGRLYAVRAFVRLVVEEGCPSEIYWSDYSDPFVIAPWYESGDAPPTVIQVPDAFDKNFLKSLKPNVAFSMPESMFNLINSDLSKLLDSEKPDSSGGIGLGWICSLNITIIFIVAFMLLFTFIFVLNIIFQWMLFIKICIPIPKRTE